MLRFILIMVCCALVASIALGSQAAEARTLTNSKKATWAYATSAAPVYRAPSLGSRDGKRRLPLFTENGQSETFQALSTRLDSLGRQWVKIRVPQPRQVTRWVKRSALASFQVAHTRLFINRSKSTATLFNKGRRVWSGRIGVGKSSTPTPGGRFYVREKFSGSRAPYGPVAFGTSAHAAQSSAAFGNVVGIHGTRGLGPSIGSVSHGCIRVPGIASLAPRMGVGTPIVIR